MTAYRLKSFSENGEITYSIQKRFFGFLWLTLYFDYHANSSVSTHLTDFGGFNTCKFTKQGAYNYFNDAVWTKAREIVKSRKIKTHKEKHRVTYQKFP